MFYIPAMTIMILSISTFIICTISGREGSCKVLNFIRSVNLCDQDLTTVGSTDFLLKCFPTLLLDYAISSLTIDEFIDANFTKFTTLHHRPRCIAVLPSTPVGINGATEMQSVIQKLNMKFERVSNSCQLSKPVMFLFWPELGGENVSAKHIINSAFRNTQGFKVNSDIYAIFLNRNSTSNDFNDLSLTETTSIWETYTVKGRRFYRRIPVDQLDGKVGRRGDFHKESIVASSRGKGSDARWIDIRPKNGEMKLVGGAYAFWYWDLETMLNFSLRIVDGNEIYTLPNNTLAGKTLTQLNTGIADMSLSHSLIVAFRAKELTFLQPTQETLMYTFFQQPSVNSIRNIVTAPFQTPLWATLLVTWIILIASVKAGTFLKRLNYGQRLRWNPWKPLKNNGIEIVNDTEFSNLVGMWAIATNCQKPWYLSPKSLNLRMTFIIGSFFGTVIYVAYSGAVVSSLAVAFIPVQQFVDLVTYRFTLTVHKQSEPSQVILQHLIELHDLKQPVVKYGTDEEISHLLDKQNPKAFVTYQDLFYQTALLLNYSEVFICNTLSKVRVSDFPYKSAMFLKKGSEFTESFNHKIIRIRERGFNFRYIHQYQRLSIFRCARNLGRHRNVDSIKFNDVITAFLIIWIGLLAAVSLLLCEVVCLIVPKQFRSLRMHSAC